MKHICIATGSNDDYLIMTPLIKTLQTDQSVILTVVSTRVHQNPEMEISCRRVEEEGFLVDEQTDIHIKSKASPLRICPANFNHLNYKPLFQRLKPDLLVLSGNTNDTLTAAIAASLNHITIAHIQGGESQYRVWDDAYGYGITKMSHLHFTSADKYREQVIRFGEHPDRVFNVGSLLADQIKNRPYHIETDFFDRTGLRPEDDFLFIDIHPDAAIGSKNNLLSGQLRDALSDPALSGYKILFSKPEEKGLGKMIAQMMDEFCDQAPDRAFSIPSLDLTDTCTAVKFALCVISNTSRSHLTASLVKKPVINPGHRLQDQEPTQNTIHCPLDSTQILASIQHGLSLEFNFEILQIHSPFEQASTAQRIKQALITFEASDICPKAYFSSDL